ncbi:TIGR01620 family protein [Mesocricetibacter intestinalis]|uniref:TIGR01620 family protein n=1 Tax=Mesocricetibacter intestinalis TaxID=1521930 RepID=UPI00105B57BF|nr:TIGR01620 family protein [Mesocricetibacter intestinalis]
MNQKRFFEAKGQQEQDKRENPHFTPRREFNPESGIPDPEADSGNPIEGEGVLEEAVQIINPPKRWRMRLLMGTILLFLFATVAQSVQWLLDSWNNHQWIYFAFAVVAFIFVLLGVTSILREWRRLSRLRKRMILQRRSAAVVPAGGSALDFGTDLSFEQSKSLCLSVAENMQIPSKHPLLTAWQKQINETHSGAEVAYLFSRTVLHSFDRKALGLISKNALEAGAIVAVSPLAVVDMFFIAWRNIRLVNRLSAIYGVELGYISRLRLMRLVFLNIAFAGASELVQDIGMDWLSQDMAAKLSARAAQGIGVGLLTARLGIKTMEACRPLLFRPEEKPSLKAIHRELLSSFKSTLLTPEKLKRKLEL